MILAIGFDHFAKVMKELVASQIKIHPPQDYPGWMELAPLIFNGS
jgi:hypothetical protein